MPDTVIATTTSVSVGYDLLTPLLKLIFGSDGVFSSVSLDVVMSFMQTLWGIFIILSYLISFLFLYLYIYASIHKSKLEEIQSERLRAQEHAFASANKGVSQSDRLYELHTHIDSDNPNDWKLALIEADIILDEVLKQKGYSGTSLGERLRSISPTTMASIDDAWQAHKVRNQIAHAGPGFVLTSKLARETIVQYEKVFKELGVV
ncbi:hypothetical protein CO026_00115 [Candidatus Kaiserbacteria bacterium CG_4_9_14_0_2_um_filter_41_32]|uniref:Uncharacterized protein n=1 Tax=Candidatus Kaiserbacteria bacterium CG_4_9_14_0_2_um_filter_41_32 TaxID=1974601 RepID=A0A2M8FFQ3_9BACT|nr:hypothetical protein [Candidatus Kaiserbacteria bacterium]PJC56474.1 MAG: hypothetical protein CO026_00115 [Candidatus Kaiserbacteria bacterium CG_4_9_14_0_2_um_filter_41_32]